MLTFLVLGAPIGSFIGGYMFKSIGSIASFKIFGVIAFITCIIQFVFNYLMNRLSKNEDIKETYDKVETKDDAEDNIAIF